MEIRLKLSKLTGDINKKELFKNLLDFNWFSFLSEVVTIDSSLERKAFLLLFKSTQKTFVDIAKELGQEQIDKRSDLLIINTNIEQELKSFFEQEVIIDKNFFTDVFKYNQIYLTKSFQIFKQYLISLGITIPDNYNYEFYLGFRQNIQEVYQEDKEAFQDLRDHFDNPIFEENRKYKKLFNYYQKISSYFSNPLQPNLPDCKETLSDLYIKPNFNVYKNSIKLPVEDVSDFVKIDEMDVHAFINKHFLKGTSHELCSDGLNMVLVLGQPGQGKTSFCYKVVDDYLNSASGLPQIPIAFIKLRDVNARDFVDRPFETLKNYINIDIDFNDDSCIIVLDGLDETYMAGGLNNFDLRNLYDRLNKASRQNQNLKIILTSRLTYLDLKDSCIDDTLVIQLRELADNQIIEYCKKFNSFYPDNKFTKNIDSIISDKKFKHIKELLQQAAIIYFIANSEINIEEKDSKSVIYDKIFTSLAQRSWDNNKQLPYIRKDMRVNPTIYKKHLRKYIRAIAFFIYQSENLYITVNELNELEATTDFMKNCFDLSLEITSENFLKFLRIIL